MCCVKQAVALVFKLLMKQYKFHAALHGQNLLGLCSPFLPIPSYVYKILLSQLPSFLPDAILIIKIIDNELCYREVKEAIPVPLDNLQDVIRSARQSPWRGALPTTEAILEGSVFPLYTSLFSLKAFNVHTEFVLMLEGLLRSQAVIQQLEYWQIRKTKTSAGMKVHNFLFSQCICLQLLMELLSSKVEQAHIVRAFGKSRLNEDL